ncbi:MAG: formylglycine-generating enzyme family protein [Chloroflexi bacterium]|uniref:formylglycine-generating enzyme family protein n=1 Tax=Candidatus Flexifilum breve TaxID=3140694 RepID=UPI00313569EF|nr:formylglycine-generating enzyme family protein [Chloroflexota bacterium]
MAADFAFPGEARPVENINWFEARDFCALREARLPTEREWEYAARGPDSLTYPWGNVFVPENVVYNRVAAQGTADVVDAEGNPARPGGASWVGALDMSGNVYEWTSTRYDELDYSQLTLNFQGLFPYPYRENDGREADETQIAFNRRVSEQSFYVLRVLRGGAWDFTGTVVRGAARNKTALKA